MYFIWYQRDKIQNVVLTFLTFFLTFLTFIVRVDALKGFSNPKKRVTTTITIQRDLSKARKELQEVRAECANLRAENSELRKQIEELMSTKS